MISFTLRAAMTSIDIPYGSQIGDAAVAAIGLAFPLDFFFIAVWVGISTSLTSHLSRAMGERHEPRLQQLVRSCTRIVMCISGGLVALAVGLYFAAPSLGLDADVAGHFRVYAPLLLLGASVGLWSTLPDSIVKAHHDTKTTMVAGLLSGGLNLLLNTLFLFGFGWGIFGIGLATALARVGSLLYALWRARTLERARLDAWSEMDVQPVRASVMTGLTAAGVFLRPYRALLLLAVPTALSFGMNAVESLIVNALLATGEQATASIAAYAVYHRAMMLLSMPIIATGIAILPFAAKSVGEGDVAHVRAGVRQAFVYAALYGVCFVIPVCAWLAEPLADFLGRAASTRELAGFAIRWAVPASVLASIPFILSRPVFESVQRGAPGLLMSAVRSVFLAGPLALGGAWVATRLGYAPFPGILLGLIAGSATISLAMAAWLIRLFAALQKP